jgi:iron-sulfur cluster assembly accessory protein
MLLRNAGSESVACLRQLRALSSAPNFCRGQRHLTAPSPANQHQSRLIQTPCHPVASLASNFSSAAAELPTDATPKKTNRNRDPITVTPAAASRIYNLISNHNQSRSQDLAIGIRLGTKKRGCNGLSYTLDYAYENHTQKHKRDEAMEISFDDATIKGHGLKVFIEPMALMNVIGTKMDFVDDEMSSEFTFTNPNSKGECGCGESFNV